MTKKTAHIISHSHWDREWYLPFEKHRYYLVQLIDDLLEKLTNDPDFKSFHMDGHTLLIDDYLEIKPEKREEVMKYIQEKRIHVGPWYMLQDAFLTSAEANIRNLVIGLNESKKYGSVSMLGYFPDTFGVYGQAPQILQQAGIDTAAFGRGVKPTGFNNQVSDHINFESPFSELTWKSPDGSDVLGILFANWYSNGNEIPTDEMEAKAFWDQKLADVEKYASTPHLLFMNGCDHQPLQKDIPEALRVAEELYPDVSFVHSNFDDYIQAVKKTVPENLQVIDGELRNQKTDGWSTLVNTASARIYLKQMNHKNQNKLERLLEPLATFSYLLGEEYPEEYIRHAWKTLMKNHPHDSICGCSVDEVHEEMVTRFLKVDQMTDMLIEEQVEKIVDQIEVKIPKKFDEAIPLIALNTVGHERSVVIEKIVDYERVYFRDMNLSRIPTYLEEKELPELMIVNHAGEPVAATISEHDIRFGYDLPDDAFRQPYYAKRLHVTFATEELPAFGYDTYFIVEKQGNQIEQPMMTSDYVLENDYLKVVIHPNGTYDIQDKQTGKIFTKLGHYEDTSDIGNEYMFKMGVDEKPYSTKELQAEIKTIENTNVRAVVEIQHSFEIPASASEAFEQVKDHLVWHPHRDVDRSEEMVVLSLTTTLTLDHSAKGLKVHLTINNTAEDHRLRVMFPTNLETEHHLAESAFEIVKRPNKPGVEWENPSYDHHQQTFASLSDGEYGLTVATKGLQEYEVIQEHTTLAVTVLRSVSELGDWGYFPTPGAQCLGEQTAEWYVIPHEGNAIEAKAYEEAYHFQTPTVTTQAMVKEGSLPVRKSFLHWRTDGLVFTSLKKGETDGKIFMRTYNPSAEEKSLSIDSPYINKYYASNVIEEVINEIGNHYKEKNIKPYKIHTVAMEGFKDD